MSINQCQVNKEHINIKNIGFPYIACLRHFAKINSFATREEIEGVKELEHIATRLMDGSNNGSSTPS